MSIRLFHDIPSPFTTLFGTIDGHVQSGGPVFIGTPGSVTPRTNKNGTQYFVHRFYDGSGKQKETYLGVEGECDDQVFALREQIREAKSLVPELRLLIRAGYQCADAKNYATMATLHKHGLFAAGATLIGSHAFGVILNHMGVRAAAYATDDIDVARSESLAFEQQPNCSFLDILRESGIHFIEVPQLDPRIPSSSFKQQGRSQFHVDLLMPSVDDDIHIVPVPELKAHATALPFLSYLLAKTQICTLISREGSCPVRVPSPERFAIHKLVVSQLRTNMDVKSQKDIMQASILLAAMAEHYPGAIESAVDDLPATARKNLVKASSLTLGKLQGYPRAVEEFSTALGITAGS